MDTDLGLIRLLQLVSPGLPIGMYSYSQGLERAVDDRLIDSPKSAGEWIGGIMQQSLVRVDVPILFRLMSAWQNQDLIAVSHWSKMLVACRETSELRAEDRQTGHALAKLLYKLDIPSAEIWQRQPETTLATLFALAAVSWGIAPRIACMGYVWGWLENQVLCAVKLVPLGQVAGQQLLQSLSAQIPNYINQSASIEDAKIGGSAFGLALASSRHEAQYSRLFRS